MYKATLCKLTNLQKHPNADRLMIANALGYYIIVDLKSDEDTLGIVFPSDGRLTNEMCMNNNLYRKHPVTDEEMGGYFEPTGRVKTLKLRGSKSEAFWIPLTSLSWAGDITTLEDEYNESTEKGELCQLDTFNGHKICEKYYTPETLREMKRQRNRKPLTRYQKIMRKLFGKGKKEKVDYAPEFKKHFSTTKLREVVQFIQGTNTEFIVTYKLHGTSGRTGLVQWQKRSNWQQILAKTGLYKDSYRYVTGSRKVTLDPDFGTDNGYYAGTNFRREIHDMISNIGLNEDEILYYEIVGYASDNKLIMDTHSVNKDEMKQSGIPSKEYKQLSDKMSYTYGCEPGEYKVFVYRITQDGEDLSWNDLVSRCGELGLETVPYADTMSVTEDMSSEDIMNTVEVYTRGMDVLDDNHIKEGVCLRIEEDGKLQRILKYKGFLFALLEGIRKNTPEYIDLEEIS